MPLACCRATQLTRASSYLYTDLISYFKVSYKLDLASAATRKRQKRRWNNQTRDPCRARMVSFIICTLRIRRHLTLTITSIANYILHTRPSICHYWVAEAQSTDESCRALNAEHSTYRAERREILVAWLTTLPIADISNLLYPSADQPASKT